MLLAIVAASLLSGTPGQEPTTIRTTHWNRCVNFKLPDETDAGNENPEEAFASCNWLLQNSTPTPAEKAFIYTNRAGMFIVKKDYNAARVDATSAIEIDDFNNDFNYRALAHFTRARALYFQQKYREALADVEAALAAHPTARYYGARAELKDLLGDIEGALKDWSTVKLLDPARLKSRYCEVLIDRGRRLLASKDNYKAKVHFELAASCPATKNQALLWHARVNRIDFSLASALEDIDKLLAADPGFPGAHIERGMTLEQLDKPDEALTAYSSAIAINARDAAALGRRASLLGRREQYQRAFVDAEAALAIDPRNADALVGRGIAHLARHEPEHAASDLSNALSAGAPDVPSRAYRGLAYLQLKEFRKAAEDFEASLKTESPWQAYFGRAVLREQQEDALGAGRDLASAARQTGYSPAEIAAFGFTRSVMELWPSCEQSPMSWQSNPQPCTRLIESGKLGLKDLARALLLRGESYNWDDDALALEDFSRAIATAPGLGKAYYERGYLHWRAKRFDLAIADFSRAIELGSEVSDALKRRGKTYLGTGAYKLALADFDAAVTQFKSIEAVAYRSLAKQNLGDWKGADQDFLTALAESPSFARTTWEYETGIEPKTPPSMKPGPGRTGSESWLRCTFYRPQQIEACSALISAGTEIVERQTVLRLVRADAYQRSQQYALAVSDYTWLLERDEKNWGYRFDRALAFIKSGDLKSASFDLDILVSTAGDTTANVHFLRGVVRERMGNAQGAASDFAIAVQRDPNIAESMAKLGVTRSPAR